MYSFKRENRGKPKKKQKKAARQRFGQGSIMSLHRKLEKQKQREELEVLRSVQAQVESAKPVP